MTIEFNPWLAGLIAWLVGSYALGARVIRRAYRVEPHPEPVGITALSWLASPAWVPFYAVGRVLLVGAKPKQTT